MLYGVGIGLVILVGKLPNFYKVGVHNQGSTAYNQGVTLQMSTHVKV